MVVPAAAMLTVDVVGPIAKEEATVRIVDIATLGIEEEATGLDTGRAVFEREGEAIVLEA